MNKIQGLLRSTRAATAVEYGLILALIFIAAMSAMTAVGKSANTMWNHVSDTSTEAMNRN
ncbi:Flp family type IVb pilin [Sphingopyxis sp.]|jgi:pilus assembly protein Flp/PilA|uniref:Flp family type IVb pilin n=1 Tax=Sphingopyxis sp. TaxID=1908224 RepID=UPI0026196EEF|nr:Flp family type IVb pilin [Sphingopyxis sp.]MCW0199601.1 Flp family type IVb pilin [Sphingopyxis sp.]